MRPIGPQAPKNKNGAELEAAPFFKPGVVHQRQARLSTVFS